jgi:hypothetical protein
MTPAFSARRRADEFEALLSRGPDSRLSARETERYAALLELVGDLRAVPDAAPRPEFVSSLRERLMAEADTVLVRQPASPERLAMPAPSRTRDRRVGALLGAAALVGATATMAVAAQTSLPGESLYGVKRGIESAQVRLADDDAARGRTLLAQAETRLGELEELAGGDGAAAQELIPDTLDTFTAQSGDGVRSLLAAYARGGSEQDVQSARDFTATSLDRLEALQSELPESARDELDAAGRTLIDLDLEISTSCPACGGGITTTPEFLRSSAPTDLLTGLDSDEVTLEAAPVSGQDLTGITVPEVLQSPGALLPTAGATTVPSVSPPKTPEVVVPDATKKDPERPGKVTDVTQGVTQGVTEGVTEGVTDTTTDLTTQLDGATGGALGGLTSGLDDATGGLIGEVTGTVDGLTGGTVSGVTGGLLP